MLSSSFLLLQGEAFLFRSKLAEPLAMILASAPDTNNPDKG
jgi:hypothetical protein